MKLFRNHPRLRRVLLWGGGALVLLAVLLGAGIWFLLATQGGTEFLFTRLGALMPGELEVAELHGPIRGPLDIRGLSYKRDGLEMHVKRVQLDWSLRELLSRQLDIRRLHAEGIRIIPTPTAEKEEPTALPDVNLGFNILVRDAQVRDLQIGAPGEEPLVIDRIDLATTAIGNKFQIDRFVVRAPLLDGDISGSFQPQGDYPVDLQVQWKVRPPDMAGFSGRGALTGSLEELKVAQTLDAPFPARLDATLLQPLRDLAFDGRVAFSDFNPRLIKADFPDLPARGEVTAKGQIEAFTSSGTVRGQVEQAGGPVEVAYRLSRDGERWTVQQADIAFPGTPTRLDASGLFTVSEKDKNVEIQAQANWRNLRWPLRGGEPTVASSRGNATVSGTTDRYTAQVEADLTKAPGGEILPGKWMIEGEGNRESFRFAQLAGNLLGGRIAGNGEIVWKPQVRWKAMLRGQGIDTERLSAEFPGDLAFTASTSGRLEDAGPYGTVDLPRFAGTLRGQPVNGTAALQLGGEVYQLSRLDLDWGTIDLAASGRLAPTLDLAWNVAAPNLGIAVPQGGGSLVAQGRVSGPTATPRIQMNAKAEDLIFGETRAAAADLTADVDLAPSGVIALDLQSTGVRSGEQTIKELTVRGRGTRGSHTVTASALSEEDRLDLALAGGIAGTTEAIAWNGQIQRLDVRSRLIGDWSLAAPAALAASQQAVRLRDFCWRSGGARLCADGGWAQAGTWDVDASVADFPLNTFRPYLPEDLVVTGDINGTVQARGNGSALASANVDLRPGPGEIRFPGKEGQTVSFPFEQAVVRAQAGAGGAGEATASLVLRDVGNLSARLSLPRFTPGMQITSQPLSGRIDVNLRNLAFVEGFVPDVNDLSGALVGGYALSGTVGSPRFVGRAELQNARVDIPRFGLEIREARLAAVGNGTGALTIDGSLRSGPGTLTITGQAGVPSPETPIRLAIKGNRFLASDTEEIRALVSPDLTFNAQGQKAELTGEIVIPEADIEIEKRGEKGPVKASNDVVFVRAGQEVVAEKQGLDLTARVRFVLGKDVDVAVLGLKAEPTGSVLVIQRGAVTRATGEVEVSGGTFKAYGQDLTIERGRLVFAGPVNNPGVDLRAYRKADDGTVAGIEARGSLQKPEVTLWSNPAMAQSEQLSYILLGRPLNQTQPQEGDLLANAATSLGIRGGNMLAKRLAARYGLEEARIETKGSLEEASLVVGKYLSPKLYVSFGMGLFEPVNTFRIRYLLSDKWSLQAENSGAATGADALYTIER